MWYRNNWSDSDRIRERRGTAIEDGADHGWHASIAFADTEGVSHRLIRRYGGWGLRRETGRHDFHRHSRPTSTAWSPLGPGRGRGLSLSPFAAWGAEERQENDEPGIGPATFTVEAKGQATIADYRRLSGTVENEAEAIGRAQRWCRERRPVEMGMPQEPSGLPDAPCDPTEYRL